MNKSDLVKNISLQIDSIKKNDIEEAINQLIYVISDTLLKKNRVEIRGFGSFSSRHRSARLARNPKTGTSITLGSKFYTYFRPSKLLKQQVKN
jgi:integration host factor subunit beta